MTAHTPNRTADDLDELDDAVSLLMADHRHIKQLFFEYAALADDDDGVDGQRADLSREICIVLEAHSAAEEEIFYPALREASRDDDLIDEALADHASLQELIEQISVLDPSDYLFDTAMRMLQEVVELHIEEEETGLLPLAEESGLDLEALGQAIVQCKMDVLARLDEDSA